MNVIHEQRLKQLLDQKGNRTINFQMIQPFFQMEGLHLQSHASSINLMEAFNTIQHHSLFTIDEAKAMVVCIKENYSLAFNDFSLFQKSLKKIGEKKLIIIVGSYIDPSLEKDEKVLSIYFFGFPRKKEIIENLLSKTRDEKERKYLQKERLKGLFVVK